MFYKAVEGTETFEEYGTKLIPGWKVATKEFGNQRRKEIVKADAEDIAALLANEWEEEACQALCELAGLKDEWDAAGDNAEDIVYKAANILDVEI